MPDNCSYVLSFMEGRCSFTYTFDIPVRAIYMSIENSVGFALLYPVFRFTRCVQRCQLSEYAKRSTEPTCVLECSTVGVAKAMIAFSINKPKIRSSVI